MIACIGTDKTYLILIGCIEVTITEQKVQRTFNARNTCVKRTSLNVS